MTYQTIYRYFIPLIHFSGEYRKGPFLPLKNKIFQNLTRSYLRFLCLLISVLLAYVKDNCEIFGKTLVNINFTCLAVICLTSLKVSKA